MKNKLTILLTLLLAGCSTVQRDEEPTRQQINWLSETNRDGKVTSFPVTVEPRR